MSQPSKAAAAFRLAHLVAFDAPMDPDAETAWRLRQLVVENAPPTSAREALAVGIYRRFVGS